MSIIVNNLSYAHFGGEPLFSGISFSIPAGRKASLIGDNGVGKSTLLAVVAGRLAPTSGEITLSGTHCFVPQHFGQYDRMTVADALGVGDRVRALRAILGGDPTPNNYTLLDEHWDIEERIRTALDKWRLGDVDADSPMSRLSGGEKTKVFLAGIDIHTPDIILMDEPTNHLDREGRTRLYELIGGSRATMLIVSHDRELLSLPDTTFELTPSGIERYGGNYDFYKSLHDVQLQALDDRISESAKALRDARRTARETAERKARMDARGEQKQKKAGVARIMMNTIRDGAEKSASKLKDRHSEKIEALEQERRELRTRLSDSRNLKIKLDDSGLHRGKILFTARGINFGYSASRMLWPAPFDLQIASGDRIAISGANGSGKTTLLGIITGRLEPTVGTVVHAAFDHLYIDQEYSLIDNRLSVLGQLESCNSANHPDHWLKTELHRFLFPAGMWDRPCSALSGGEKMRLMLCCMEVSNSAPDMIILDEPTNNLDIRSMEILTSTMTGYGGTLLVISHDAHFLSEIGVERYVVLEPNK
ncbi:ATP-binding cassette domain-containing protein [Alistipes sp. OttesenSCG-928-B03]|nr:ATP-binding cassette domain-containing protein [Alistipes sp. OttesenSCG-928-B03]